MCSIAHHTNLQSDTYKKIVHEIFAGGAAEDLCRGLMMGAYIKGAITETELQKQKNKAADITRGVFIASNGAGKTIGVASYQLEDYKEARKVVGRQLVLKLLCTAAKEAGGIAGCGKRLLKRVETLAAAKKVRVLKLLARHEAMAFYKREGLVACEDACLLSCKPGAKLPGAKRQDQNMSKCFKCSEVGRKPSQGRCKWTNKCPVDTHSAIVKRLSTKKRTCAAGEKVKVTCSKVPHPADVKTGPRGGKYVVRNARKQYCSTINAFKKPRKQQTGKVGRPKKVAFAQDVQKVDIYTIEGCPYCDNAKKEFEDSGVKYTEHAPTEKMETVPQIYLNGKHMGGSESVKKVINLVKGV